MKNFKRLVLTFIFIQFFTPLNSNYIQQTKIFLFATNQQASKVTGNILQKFGVKYENIAHLNVNDNKNLYIIAGEAALLNASALPKYYILYQKSSLDRALSQNILKVFHNAIAVWDSSQRNISNYKNVIKHFYFLPNENYEFLDPVLLPLFLPIEALNSYRNMLAYSNTNPSDISSHIPSLFCHSLFAAPKIIVEAGVRWGNGSTIPCYEATKLLGVHLIGIDIDDCSNIYSKLGRAHFVRMNDVEFPNYFKQMYFSGHTGKKAVDRTSANR